MIKKYVLLSVVLVVFLTGCSLGQMTVSFGSTPDPVVVVVATATIAPTPTPVPTATPDLDVLEDIKQYAADMQPVVESIIAHVNKTLDAAGGEKVNWILLADEATETFGGSHEKLLAIEPPAKLAAIHQSILDGSSDCVKSADALQEIHGGMDFNSQKFMQSPELLASCSAKIQAAMLEMLRIIEKNSTGS